MKINKTTTQLYYYNLFYHNCTWSRILTIHVNTDAHQRLFPPKQSIHANRPSIRIMNRSRSFKGDCCAAITPTNSHQLQFIHGQTLPLQAAKDGQPFSKEP
jgi:hypothetical protein